MWEILKQQVLKSKPKKDTQCQRIEFAISDQSQSLSIQVNPPANF